MRTSSDFGKAKTRKASSALIASACCAENWRSLQSLSGMAKAAMICGEMPLASSCSKVMPMAAICDAEHRSAQSSARSTPKSVSGLTGKVVMSMRSEVCMPPR